MEIDLNEKIIYQVSADGRTRNFIMNLKKDLDKIPLLAVLPIIAHLKGKRFFKYQN